MDIRAVLRETRRNFTENDMMVLHMRRVKQLYKEQTECTVHEQKLITRSKQWVSMSSTQSNEWLKEEKLKIIEEQRRLLSLRSGAHLHSYLLDAALFLNAHHTLSARISTDASDKAKLNFQIKQNTRQYMIKFFPSLMSTKDTTMAAVSNDEQCKHCSGRLIESENSYIVCEGCGTVDRIGFSRDAQQNLNYSDIQDLSITRQFTYRRLNHFREMLRQIQGRSNTKIPSDVILTLKQEFTKSRIALEKVSPRIVRKFLKKLGYTKYYEQIEGIASMLNRTYI